MKKFIILLICLSKSVTLFCQNYHPVLGETNQWVVYITGNPYDAYSTIACNVIYYTTKGDTGISTKRYKRIFAKTSCANECMCKTGFIGLIREDTSLQKIFYRDNHHPNERVIYDFSLKDGDSMYVNIDSFPPLFSSGTSYPAPKSDYYKVETSSVKTYFGSGKKIKLSNKKYYSDFTLEWVEGLGSMKSPLYFLNPPLAADGGYPRYLVVLNCAKKDSMVTLGNNQCGFLAINNPQYSLLKETKAYLSSSYISLWVDSRINGPWSIRLFDVLGNCIYQSATNHLNNTNGFYQFNFQTELKKGVYLINLSNGQIQTTLKTVNY